MGYDTGWRIAEREWRNLRAERVAMDSKCFVFLLRAAEEPKGLCIERIL